MALTNANSAQLAAGLNRALLGEEILQFAQAEPLGDSQWRLSGLFRGRGGTEYALDEHQVGEAFVLLDSRPLLLDAALISAFPSAIIVAAGRGDDEPVEAAITMRGATQRPLSPVHARAEELPDGSLSLAWTRRARGAWVWANGVEVPLREETERYLVTYGPIATPVAAWTVSTNALLLSPQEIIDLQAASSNETFHVRQQGSFATSVPLPIVTLN